MKRTASMASMAKTALMLGLAICCAAPASGWAQQQGGGMQQQAGGQAGPPSAEQVLTQMHMANLMMIRLGELAEQKGQSPLIRRQGDREARDHRFGDRKVTALAEELDVQLPEQLPSPGQGASPAAGQGPGGGMPQGGPPKQLQQMMQMAQKLQQAPPEQFDAQYRQAMVRMHGQMLEQLQQARSALGEDSPVGALIGKVRPILDQHHDLAVALEDDVPGMPNAPAAR